VTPEVGGIVWSFGPNSNEPHVYRTKGGSAAGRIAGAVVTDGGTGEGLTSVGFGVGRGVGRGVMMGAGVGLGVALTSTNENSIASTIL